MSGQEQAYSLVARGTDKRADRRGEASECSAWKASTSAQGQPVWYSVAGACVSREVQGQHAVRKKSACRLMKCAQDAAPRPHHDGTIGGMLML
jgi:hypothetical protein